jgi:Cof subfamily protein (haloacid dehalogenase superfamily)
MSAHARQPSHGVPHPPRAHRLVASNAKTRCPTASTARDAEPPKPDIGLVAVDLDGTLLNDSKRVSIRTAKALACLPSRGVKVVIASARPPRSVRPVYSLLKLDTWQINYNGALIYDPPNDKVILHRPMSCEIAWSMIERARGLYPKCLVSCEILDKWYTDRQDQPYTTETGRLFKPNLVAPLEQFCNQPITKLLLLGSRRMIDRLEPVLRVENPAVAVIRSDPELIQVMQHGCSKGEALKKVASHYGIPMRRVLAIGDAANDVCMLEAAGVGVAMDNAHPSVKQVADWVAPSNNDHGVHAALKRYGLCG